MDYDEFLEVYQRLSFHRNYQQIIVKTLLESPPNFTAKTADLEQKLKENATENQQVGEHLWNMLSRRGIFAENIVTKTGDIIKLNLEEKDQDKIDKLIRYVQKTIDNPRLETSNQVLTALHLTIIHLKP